MLTQQADLRGILNVITFTKVKKQTAYNWEEIQKNETKRNWATEKSTSEQKAQTKL